MKDNNRKNYFSRIIVGMIIGIIAICGIQVVADTTLISGNKISYSNSSSRLSSTNMQGAMDELYALARHSETYTYPANSTGATVDLGDYHHYKYVNAGNVYNKGKSDGKATCTGGNATAAQILSGRTAYVNGSSVTGTMPSNASSAGVKEDKAWAYNNRMYFGIDYGYYPAASFGGMSNVSERYITYSSLARDIGLTAPKILKGNTILGIAGTADGKTNHTDTYILAASETTKDLTADHPYRYIDATNVYNKGKSDGEANKAQNLNVTYIWNDRNVDENDGIDKSYTFPYSGTVRIDWRLYYCRYYGGYDPYVDLRGTRLGTTSGSGTYTVNAGDVIHAYQHPALVGDPDSDGFLSVLYMY